jgi:hypothetical protein
MNRVLGKRDNTSNAGYSSECIGEHPFQQIRMWLTATTQAFVTLSIHQLESAQGAICC